MRGTIRQYARRSFAVAAVICLALAIGAPSSRAQEEDTVPRPEVFRGNASSLVASVQVDRDALIPVPELFRFIALDGAGTYESSNQEARASLFFPGNGFILGPSLACGTFGAKFPEFFKPILDACLAYKYPLTVYADTFEPDGTTTGALTLGTPSDPLSGNAVRAKAHAGEDAATTDAAMQDLRLIGLPLFGPVPLPLDDFELDTSLLTIDSATSRTNQRITKGSLLVDAESTLSGVRMVGGLIRIGSLRSESHVTDDGHGHRTAVAKLETSGVTVAGVPAQFTDRGIVLGDPSGSSGPLAEQQQKAANDALQAFNIKVTTLASEQELDKNGFAVANVGGLLIEFSREAQDLPTIPGADLDPNGVYTGSFQLGTTGALGSAATFGYEDFPVPPAPGGTDGAFSEAPAIDVPAEPAGDLSNDVIQTPSPISPAQPAEADTPQQLTRSLGDIFGDRIGLLYLSMAFAALAVCLLPGLTISARLPGPRN